jgi:hypothetical protein
LVQQIFDSELNTFCRKFLVKTPGVAEPSQAEFALEMGRQQKMLFENLLLFNKLSLKVTGESIAIPVLIGLFGQKGFDSLIEQGAIEFVLWDEQIAFLIENIPGVDGMVSMTHNTPEYTDLEKSIETGLSWMRDAPKGRKRRQLIRRLVPLFRKTEENLAAASLKIVRDALKNGSLEHYGIPKVAGEHADNLTGVQKHIVAKCAEDLTEYEFLLKNNMTSFSNYRYFSPFWSSAERFQVMNRTVTGFSCVSKLEGLPDLKALFDELNDPLKRLSEIRKTTNARLFREWLEKTAGESPDPDMVKAYLEASERKGILDSAPRKLLKTVALAAVGMGVGTLAAEYAGAAIGAASGIACCRSRRENGRIYD